ncbi:MAG TPA: glycine--tRNA ligase subunit beta [Vicinamibacterales bacterium]
MDRELLLEIGVEELPAAWLPGLTKQLSEKLLARLKEMRLTPDVTVESFSTPRRLTARIGRMPERQEDLDETITGPPVSAAFNAAGEPTPAALGFAKKQGVPFDALTRVKTDKGEYLAARKHHRGKSTVDALPALLGSLLRDLTFPKQMHWDARLEDGKGELLFGRPIRWMLYLYGGRVVPFTIGRAPNAAGAQVQEVTTGAVTYGHRFLATSGRAGRSIKVRTFDEYRARLPEHFVILDHAERRDRIARELEAKARKLGARVSLREHAALVDEVADLVEFPGVVAGFFERGFLDLPHEVLTTTLVHHQHFFPVLTDGGDLKEAFLAVVNTQPSDERLIAKNAERVVTARLRDAKFFWDADRQIKLEDRRDRLHTIVFHKKLGSYRDKAERIEPLARWIASDALGLGADAAPAAKAAAETAATAARLAKADLVTDMVFEFPELQGTMGGVYAREEGLPEQIWKAIYYQYLPIGVEVDAAPSRGQLGAAAVTWAAVSLADKLDTVVGSFWAGEKVTGSRDPFGLRRAAQGIVKLLADRDELGLPGHVSLGMLVDRALAGYGQTRPAEAVDWSVNLKHFFAERVRHLLERRGATFNELNAIVPLETSLDELDPLEARLRLDALRQARTSERFQKLAELFKRVKNISKGISVEMSWAEISDYGNHSGEPAERPLFVHLAGGAHSVEEARKERRYLDAFMRLADLQSEVARFFDDVMVMADDPVVRRARLQLMANLRDLVLRIADISEVATDETRQA